MLEELGDGLLQRDMGDRVRGKLCFESLLQFRQGNFTAQFVEQKALGGCELIDFECERILQHKALLIVVRHCNWRNVLRARSPRGRFAVARR